MAGRRTVGAQSNTGIARLEAGVYRAIVEVFNREFTNPELDPLTITRVALTRDGSLVRVYFADGRLAPFAEPSPETMEALASTTSLLRRRIARLQMRTTPKIQFLVDETQWLASPEDDRAGQ